MSSPQVGGYWVWSGLETDGPRQFYSHTTHECMSIFKPKIYGEIWSGIQLYNDTTTTLDHFTDNDVGDI